MESQNSPDSDPDETQDESPKSDLAEEETAGLPLSRRATLASVIGLGGLGLTSGTAAAGGTKKWKKDRDADGNDLFNLGMASASTVNATSVNTDLLSDNGSGTINLGALVDADKNEVKQLGAVAMQQNKTKIVDFAGDNLTIDSNNVLNASVNPDTRTDVSDDGGLKVSDTKDINFAAGLSVTDDGDDSVTVDSSWEDADSDGLLEPTDSAVTGVELQDTPIEAGPTGAAVVGGGGNTVSENLAIALGGLDNTASGLRAVACGNGSIASGENAFAGGGDAKRPSKAAGVNSFAFGNGAQATSGNAIALGDEATSEFTGTAVAMGSDATASEFSAMALGPQTDASGEASVAIGYEAAASELRAMALGWATADSKESFIWGDGSDRDFSTTSGSTGPTGNRTVHMLADSGFRFATETDNSGDPTQGARLTDATSGWSSFSTRTVKQDIAPADPETVLEGVEELNICEWSYESAPDIDHVGPMAEDFSDAFGVGESNKHIDGGDADGVALAAIQGLSQKLDEKDARIDDLEAELDAKNARIDDQRDRIDRLEARVERKDDQIEDLGAQNEELRERLSAIEDRLSSLEAGQSSSATADD